MEKDSGVICLHLSYYAQHGRLSIVPPHLSYLEIPSRRAYYSFVAIPQSAGFKRLLR